MNVGDKFNNLRLKTNYVLFFKFWVILGCCHSQECNSMCRCQEAVMDCSNRTINREVKVPRRIEIVIIQQAYLTNVTLNPTWNCEFGMPVKTELNLAHNLLKELYSIRFSCIFLQFSKVILDNNLIDNLDVRFGFYDSKHLSLKTNFIEFIKKINFLNYVSLNTLILSHNKIRSIEEESFPPMLTKLDLSWNELEILHEKSLSNLRQLAILNLSRNRLESLNKDLFKGLKALQFINLSGNFFQVIPYNALQRVTLSNLNLSSNQIRSTRTFEVLLLRVDAVDLSNNILTAYSFASKFKHIKSLNLSNNSITTLGEAPVQKTMENVDVSMNNLEKFEMKLFENVPGLQQVNISFNSFSVFGVDWGTFNSSAKFDVSGNDASCNCEVLHQHRNVSDSECKQNQTCPECMWTNKMQKNIIISTEEVCQTLSLQNQTAYAAFVVIPLLLIVFLLLAFWRYKLRNKQATSRPQIVVVPSNSNLHEQDVPAVGTAGPYAMANDQTSIPKYTEVQKPPTVIRRSGVGERSNVESGIYERISAYMENPSNGPADVSHDQQSLENSGSYSQSNYLSINYERAEVGLYATTN